MSKHPQHCKSCFAWVSLANLIKSGVVRDNTTPYNYEGINQVKCKTSLTVTRSSLGLKGLVT